MKPKKVFLSYFGVITVCLFASFCLNGCGGGNNNTGLRQVGIDASHTNIVSPNIVNNTGYSTKSIIATDVLYSVPYEQQSNKIGWDLGGYCLEVNPFVKWGCHVTSIWMRLMAAGDSRAQGSLEKFNDWLETRNACYLDNTNNHGGELKQSIQDEFCIVRDDDISQQHLNEILATRPVVVESYWYRKPGTSAVHFYVIIGRQGDKYICHDPVSGSMITDSNPTRATYGGPNVPRTYNELKLLQIRDMPWKKLQANFKQTPGTSGCANITSDTINVSTGQQFSYIMYPFNPGDSKVDWPYKGEYYLHHTARIAGLGLTDDKMQIDWPIAPNNAWTARFTNMTAPAIVPTNSFGQVVPIVVTARMAKMTNGNLVDFGDTFTLTINVAGAPNWNIGTYSSKKYLFEQCYYRNGGQSFVGNNNGYAYWWGNNPNKQVVAQKFTGGIGGDGSIIHDEKHGASSAYYVHGDIYNKYCNWGGPDSILGAPTSDEVRAATSPYGTWGCLTRFVGGTIYWSCKYGSYPVVGQINSYYEGSQGSGGGYGFPVCDQFSNAPSSWTRQNFERGYIVTTAGATQVFYVNQLYYSAPNKKYCLVFQNDGNLVLYNSSNPRNWYAIWASWTLNVGADMCVMQDDGNFVIYANNKAVWNTGTQGWIGSKLVVQDDGNMVMYAPDGRVPWATWTMNR